MRPINLLLLCFLCQKLSGAPTPPLNVTPRIDEVTVYRSGAKISSLASIKIPAGTSEVIFENLSPHFNANSLQVRITGSATLVAAVFRHKTPGPPPAHPRAAPLRDSLQGITDEFSRLAKEREVLGQESMLLEESAKRVGTTPGGLATTVSVAEIREMTSFYRQRLMEIAERLLQLTIRERALLQVQQTLQETLTRLNPNAGNVTGEIALNIESPSAQTIEINCTYLVSQAGWSPLYDLRSEGLDKPLRLIYKANVRNQTGFDWKGVRLHLSTGNPLANNDRPILSPVYSDFRSLHNPQLFPGAGAAASGINMGQSKDLARGRADAEHDAPPAPPEEAAAPQEDFLTSFDLDKPQNILADGQANIVTIDEQDMPALYEYHAVPKLEPTAFLLAKVTGYGKYNLLPGEANIFYRDTYVGKTSLNPQTTADTMLISLGRDEQISIKRVQPKDFTERKKMLDKNIKEIFTYEISVKNNKAIPVRIEILDQVPVSRQEAIEVELEERDGATYNKELGKLKWLLEIPPGQNRRVRFTYSVKYPKDQPVGIFRG